MAIGKTLNWKGLDLYYWVIMSMQSNKKFNTTTVDLVPYKDEQTRIDSIDNYVKDAKKTVVVTGHGLSVKQAYQKVMALSQPYNYVIAPEVPEVIDPVSGEIIQPYQSEEIEIREHNFFKDAEALLT